MDCLDILPEITLDNVRRIVGKYNQKLEWRAFAESSFDRDKLSLLLIIYGNISLHAPISKTVLFDVFQYVDDLHSRLDGSMEFEAKKITAKVFCNQLHQFFVCRGFTVKFRLSNDHALYFNLEVSGW